MSKLISILFLFVPVLATASNFPRVDADFEQFDRHVAKLNSDFERIPANPQDREWVKTKLRHMVEVDQYSRNYGVIVYERNYLGPEAAYFWKLFSDRMTIIDDEDRAELKKRLVIYAWFTVSEFGKVADNDAWLIVQHADRDPEFKKSVLRLLEPLLVTSETDPAHYAYLFDRVAASFLDPSKRKPQRYGTQGSCVGVGVWEPLPIEDPGKLDQRRSSVGLEPEASYIARFKDLCGKIYPTN